MTQGGEGACHCGAVRLAVPRRPDYVNDCNCSLCRTHGALWAYYRPDEIVVSGETRAYVRADAPEPALRTHFCGHCGSTTHWSPIDPALERAGVNVKLFPAEFSDGVEIRQIDGASWDV